LQFGFPPDLTWYKLLTDWGSLIGGGMALVAGLIAYLAGRSQATATRQAADTQVEAERHRYEQDKGTLRKSVALELRQMVARAYGAHNSLARLLARTSGQITSRMVESSIALPVPIVYPAVADRIALLGNEAMDLIIVYQLIEVAREGAAQLVHYRTPDDVSRMSVATAASAFLSACLYARTVLPRLKTGIADRDEKDKDLINQINEAAAAWNIARAENQKL
jgi:hypothetical protein